MGSQYMPQIERGTGLDFSNAGTITGLSGGGLPPLANDNIWIGNGAAVATPHPVTGIIALSNTGVSSINLTPPVGTITPFVVNDAAGSIVDANTGSIGINQSDGSITLDPYAFLATFPVPQSVPTGAGGLIVSWMDYLRDHPPGGIDMGVGPTTTITARQNGWHLITLFVNIDPSAVPVSKVISTRLLKNGAPIAQYDGIIDTVLAVTMPLSIIDFAVTGDLFTVDVHQFSGAAVNINGQAAGSVFSQFSIVRMF